MDFGKPPIGKKAAIGPLPALSPAATRSSELGARSSPYHGPARTRSSPPPPPPFPCRLGFPSASLRRNPGRPNCPGKRGRPPTPLRYPLPPRHTFVLPASRRTQCPRCRLHGMSRPPAATAPPRNAALPSATIHLLDPFHFPALCLLTLTTHHPTHCRSHPAPRPTPPHTTAAAPRTSPSTAPSPPPSSTRPATRPPTPPPQLLLQPHPPPLLPNPPRSRPPPSHAPASGGRRRPWATRWAPPSARASTRACAR